MADAPGEQFFRSHYDLLVRLAMTAGATWTQALAAVDEAMDDVLRRWQQINDPQAWAYGLVASKLSEPAARLFALVGAGRSSEDIAAQLGDDATTLRSDLLRARRRLTRGRTRPDQQRPDQPRPDQQRPDQQRPDQQRPDQQRPDHQRPDQPRPDQQRARRSPVTLAALLVEVGALVDEAVAARLTRQQVNARLERRHRPSGAKPAPSGYRGVTAASAAGITYRQLDYWARTELVVPSVRAAGGSGSQRLYGFRDIVTLKLVKRFLDAGVSLPNIRRAISTLRQFGDDDLATMTLICDGTTVYQCRSADEVIDLLQGGQAVFGIAITGAFREIQGTLADIPATIGERADDTQPVEPVFDELASRRARRQAG